MDEHGLKQVERYYDRLQAMYTWFWDRENLHYGFWTPGVEKLCQAVEAENEAVATRLVPSRTVRSPRVLDAGCGIGGPALYMARQFGFRVTGITISPRQVRTARRRARRRGLSHLADFRLMDYQRIDLPGERFQAAYFIESLIYSDEKRVPLSEVHHVLEPGGRIVIADAFATAPEVNDHVLMRRVRSGWAAPRLDTLDSVLASLGDAGYRIDEVADVTKEVMPSAVIQYRRAYLLHHLLRPLGEVRSPRLLRLLKGNVEAIYSQHDSLLADQWSYALISASKA